jgi:prepilin-type N-terminal cleavage/methylation domain-containing protein
MRNNSNAFSLIEVIVATSILTIAVFWVFKLIWENSKILSHSQNYIQANLLLQPSKECLDYLLKDNGINNMKSEILPMYLDLSNFTGVCSIWNNLTVNIVDNIGYSIYIEKNSEWVDYIDWKINIVSELINPLYFNYLQK